jgi:type II secretory pathway pseudopilin PulG
MRKGFTLIEILVVIAIIFSFTAFIFANYKQGQPTYALMGEAQKMSFNIRKAQNMAMSAKEFHGKVPQGGYGVYFDTNNPNYYIIFGDCGGQEGYDISGTLCNGVGEKVEKIELGSGITINDISIDSNSGESDGYVIFIPPDPRVVIGTGPEVDHIEIRINLSGGSNHEAITVNKAGKIDIE